MNCTPIWEWKLKLGTNEIQTTSGQIISFANRTIFDPYFASNLLFGVKVIH